MEYVLQDTDLFDEEIGLKFYQVLKPDIDKFDKDKVYQVTVSFHVNLLDDQRMESSYIPNPSKWRKNTPEDKVYDVLSTQLDRVKQALDENGIEIDRSKIQGDDLEVEDIIKIELSEYISEPQYDDKGNIIKIRHKANFVIPNILLQRERTSELYSEMAFKLYRNIMDIIGNKKIMSEILEIEETKNENIIFNAFARQYGDLAWVTTDREKKEELANLFEERISFVLNKYSDEGKAAVIKDNE